MKSSRECNRKRNSREKSRLAFFPFLQSEYNLTWRSSVCYAFNCARNCIIFALHTHTYTCIFNLMTFLKSSPFFYNLIVWYLTAGDFLDFRSLRFFEVMQYQLIINLDFNSFVPSIN